MRGAKENDAVQGGLEHVAFGSFVASMSGEEQHLDHPCPQDVKQKDVQPSQSRILVTSIDICFMSGYTIDDGDIVCDLPVH